MYARLFMLAYQLSGGLLPHDQISGAIRDVTDVVESEAPLFEDADGRWKTAALLLSLSFFESGWKADALGDGGKSCGVMQTQSSQKWVDGATCEKVRADRKLGYRVGLAVLRHSKATCAPGAPSRVWLGMYASGTCGMAQAAAKGRCAPAGVCDAH